MRRTTTMHALLATVVASLLTASAASATAPDRWPPVKGTGNLFVHFGEEHLDDLDGGIIFPKVIADVILWSPDLVIAAGDKTSNGTEENLLAWKEKMAAFDRAGIPYFAGVGNHDRQALPGFPNGISPLSPLGSYLTVFADRPYPFGDSPPPADPRFAPSARPANDPAGASSHYAFDFGNVRWIVIDNSCYEFGQCDRSQNPEFPDAEGNANTYGFVAAEAAEAKKDGKLVFLSMHMPTQDPRPEHSQPTPSAHTMGEGTSMDNTRLQDLVATSGIDAVHAAHIKGQWIYTDQKVPYFINGGAGGEVYVGSDEETGVDYGYWHGFRLIRVTGGKVVTDAVPVFVPGGITVTAPKPAKVGDSVAFEAFGRQPTKDGPAVEKLALRSPDPKRPNAANLPEPARIWTSGNPLVARPVAAKDDDPRRNRRTQTRDGVFAATCPGRAKVTITSGVESASRTLRVRSAPGPLVRRLVPATTTLRRGRRTQLAFVALAQPAVVEVRVLRGNRVVKTLRRTCRPAGDPPLVARWNGHGVAPGEYTIAVTIRSDRKPIVRRFALSVS